jgi:hypothetical protein
MSMQKISESDSRDAAGNSRQLRGSKERVSESDRSQIRQQAPYFAALLSAEQLVNVARCVSQQFFPSGATICKAADSVQHFFVVLSGSVLVEEPVVHHLEGGAQGAAAQGTATKTRQRMVAAGHSFHHLPLVTAARCYGYSARVAHEKGASLLLLPSADYATILHRSIDLELRATVSMLSATRFFATWTEAALTRLYFWFDQRRVAAGTEIVRQGDAADFCFIIQSGQCDVLIATFETAHSGINRQSMSTDSARASLSTPSPSAASKEMSFVRRPTSGRRFVHGQHAYQPHRTHQAQAHERMPLP